MKIAFAEYPFSRERNIDTELAYLPPGTEVVHAVYDEDAIEAYYDCLSDVDAVLTGFAPIGRSAIDRMRKCKIISVQAVGYNFVDYEYAREKGIATAAVGEYCTMEVADHTIALMLALQRRLPYLARKVNDEREWGTVLAGLETMGVRRTANLIIGIVGFGKIGRAVAERARSFGMRVIAYDPYLGEDVFQIAGVMQVDMDTLLAEADVVSVHMNLTAESGSFFDADKFAGMKRKPIFLNVARGGLVDEAALLTALESGQIRGAGLDVLSDEDPALDTNPLIGREDVIVTPHVAFYSDQSIEESERISIMNILYYLHGEKGSVFKLVGDPQQ